MGFFDGGGWGKLFENIAGGIIGSIASQFISQGLNAAFGSPAPSRHDVVRDLRAQSEALRGSQTPIRTPEQEASDKAALEATAQRQATFSQLSQEYAGLQKAGPTFDPYEEAQIRKEAMADAAVRGMAESGQAQDFVARRLDESRLKRTTEHSRRLEALRQEMVPYADVVRPGQPSISPSPAVSPIPRQADRPFTSAPLDIVSMMRPKREETKPQPPRGALGLTPYDDVDNPNRYGPYPNQV